MKKHAFTKYKVNQMLYAKACNLCIDVIFDVAVLVRAIKNQPIEKDKILATDDYFYSERLATRYILSKASNSKKALKNNRRYLSLSENERLEKIKRIMRSYVCNH